MKTTIDLPDDLVLEIKVEAARQKRKLNSLVPELVRAGLAAQRRGGPAQAEAVGRWLDEWVALGVSATRDRPPAPTASEILDAHRGRLDGR